MRLQYTIIDRPGKHDHVATWRGRCTYCGHRVGHWEWDKSHPVWARVFVPPIETRRQLWRIPSEIVLRFLAMRQARDVAWIEAASTQNPNQHPEDIHITHHPYWGWHYWYDTPTGITAGLGFYLTQSKAWRAALLEQEHDAANNTDHEDYPN